MIGATVRTEEHFDRVEKATEKAAFKNLGHAAATIRQDAIASIETSPEPSRPGEPPHTRHGRAKKAVQFAADAESAEVGFAASVIGTGMEPHEHGEGRERTPQYPERPTIGPAMERNLDQLAEDWEGSIGE